MHHLNYYCTVFFCFFIVQAFSQYRIEGNFPPLAGKNIYLKGYLDFDKYVIDNAMVSESGNFLFQFGDKDVGAGYLETEDGVSYLIILGKESLSLKGPDLKHPDEIRFITGTENIIFNHYATEHLKREQALSAWDFLTEKYEKDPLFSSQNSVRKSIKNERLRILEEDREYLQKLNKTLFVSWFLPLKKTINSLSTVLEERPEEIPQIVNTFRSIDYSDERLYKSGLLADVIEAHFYLLEVKSEGRTNYNEIETSIDALLKSLQKKPEKFNTVVRFLFNYFEKRSLFQASEYLAENVLKEHRSLLEDTLQFRLEGYSLMKIGKIAPDIIFDGDFITPEFQEKPRKLSELKDTYKLLFFGSDQCPQCVDQLLLMNRNYPKWKKLNVEVIFISLDADKNRFYNFIKPFRFISFSDYLSWSSPIIKDYHVFGTPTLLLLNGNNEIVLRPESIEQLDSWIDWKL